jgi:hypothetical protein
VESGPGRLSRRRLAGAWGVACFKVPQESASLASMEATEVTATELQMRVYEAGRRINYIIESAADTIAFHTSDPNIRALTPNLGIKPETGELSFVQETRIYRWVVSLADALTF